MPSEMPAAWARSLPDKSFWRLSMRICATKRAFQRSLVGRRRIRAG